LYLSGKRPYRLSATGRRHISLSKAPGDRLHMEESMRLDKYLKVSRLIKRRTVANEACDGGLISVNGKVQKASYDVKLGDIIELRLGSRSVKVEVLALNERAQKAEAASLYREVV